MRKGEEFTQPDELSFSKNFNGSPVVGIGEDRTDDQKEEFFDGMEEGFVAIGSGIWDRTEGFNKVSSEEVQFLLVRSKCRGGIICKYFDRSLIISIFIFVNRG